MEFGEKLQALRKDRSLTQEELAEALFVSRTAVSKWESGRGYPGIDSLKAISRFFGVSIDDLVCPKEILSAAEDEKKTFLGRWIPFLCGTLDLLPAILLFVPLFGNGPGKPSAVSLASLDGISAWIRIVFYALIGLTVLNGLSGIVISQTDRPAWNRHRLVTGIVLSAAGAALFMVTRQPYAGMIYLALLVIKGILVVKAQKG